MPPEIEVLVGGKCCVVWELRRLTSPWDDGQTGLGQADDGGGGEDAEVGAEGQF